MKKSKHSPLLFLAFIVLFCVLSVSFSIVKERWNTTTDFQTESEATASDEKKESSRNMIWHSVSHRF